MEFMSDYFLSLTTYVHMIRFYNTTSTRFHRKPVRGYTAHYTPSGDASRNRVSWRADLMAAPLPSPISSPALSAMSDSIMPTRFRAAAVRGSADTNDDASARNPKEEIEMARKAHKFAQIAPITVEPNQTL